MLVARRFRRIHRTLQQAFCGIFNIYYILQRLKRATESKAITEQRKDSISVHAPTSKLVCARKMSRKEIEETNPLIAKEITHTVINE